MSKHLVLDVVALAQQGKSLDEIAAELGVTRASVGRRIRYATKKGHELPKLPRAKRSDAGVKRGPRTRTPEPTPETNQ